MTTVNVYLNFDGNCEEAFNFYKLVFGGEFSYLGRFGEMPKKEGAPEMPKEMSQRIMHVALPISKETVLMGSDTSDMGPKRVEGNNFGISINTDSKEKADELFSKLSSGGKVTMPMEDMFWGDYFGMLEDKFGINWMISFNKNQMH